MLFQAYLHLHCFGPNGARRGRAMYIPMSTIHSRFLSKFLFTNKLSGDVRVDVTGVPDQLSVEGADSAYVVAALSRLSEAMRGLPFILLALH